jgi:8-oxo-dGTP diphosphatase
VDAGWAVTNLVLDKVAWVRLDELGRILVTRNHGRDVFYFPGGRREAGETDVDTLVREIAEELGAEVLAATTRHFGTYEVTADVGAIARMTCYFANLRPSATPSSRRSSARSSATRIPKTSDEHGAAGEPVHQRGTRQPGP